MSHLEDSNPTAPIKAKKILFNSEPEQPDRDDRVFAATGGCNLERFTTMVAYLNGTGLFTRVTQIGVIVRIILAPSRTWSDLLELNDTSTPRCLDVVRGQLGEGSVPTVLAYVNALLWEGAGWGDTADVTVEESPIG